MDLVNLSAEPLGKRYSWIPHDLHAEKIVFLPDACPGNSPLPTGTVVLTRQANWRQFAISDCGCGMRLLRSQIARPDLTLRRWDQLAQLLRANKGSRGDLGGGNHFLDALQPQPDGPLHFLIHTGSRNESGHVDHLIDQPGAFDAKFARVVQWAESNRAAIHACLREVFGAVELVLDLPHNSFEPVENGVIIRKGSVRMRPGDLSVIPSHMSGDVVLVRGTERMTEVLHSMSHGTGRAMSRGDCKPLADTFDFAALRRHILMPTGVADASLRTEGPYAYRDLDECLLLIEDYVQVVTRYSVVAYMGHL